MNILLNGTLATADDLRHLVQTNYGHFTAFRVENGGVRGLDLHLHRLQRATRELFGTELDPERVRSYLRRAVGKATQELSVRINVFSRSLDRERLDQPVETDVLIVVAPASPRAAAPLRVKSFCHARELPAIKHVGTFPLFYHRRLAQQVGFDDALFTDDRGRISEGSIWNIGFLDRDDRVVWPDGPQLDGVGMQLLKTGLAQFGHRSVVRGVCLDELAEFRAAFFTNSSVPLRWITLIDDRQFVVDDAWTPTLMQCYEATPPQPIA